MVSMELDKRCIWFMNKMCDMSECKSCKYYLAMNSDVGKQLKYKYQQEDLSLSYILKVIKDIEKQFNEQDNDKNKIYRKE